MLLPLSSRRVPRLIQLPSIPSTNDELVRMAEESASELPPFTTLVTDDQTAGRGRRGRAWSAPPGASMAISVLLRPVATDGVALNHSQLSWLALAAGVAMTDALTEVLPRADLGLKWPNDVQVGGLKISGILGSALREGVVMGAGVNVAMTEDQLPVPTATSLAIEGAAGDGLPDRVLDAYLARIIELTEAYAAQDADPIASGLHAAVVARCFTIGREVRVELPGGAALHGTAIGIDASGRLEVRDDTDVVRPVAAGDIVHLR